mmetsp:Transcript_90032/g.155985  ORF Transcript_90032/g.155985 Transcript_90032/m.155985 type:complete len:172 (+) Transcript_90032:52-567(+)
MASNTAVNDTSTRGGIPLPLEEAVSNLLTGKHAYTQSFWEDLQAFVHAVDWAKDQWIFGVFAVEVAILCLVVLSRRCWEGLAAIFVLNGVLLFFLERLNTLAREHWEAFASQQYFDESGTFACVIFGAPMLICQLVIVVLLLKEASHMVIKVKRMELKKDIKAKQETKKEQ